MMQVKKTLWLPAQWSEKLPVIAGVSLTAQEDKKTGFSLARDNDLSIVTTRRAQLAQSSGLTGSWLWLNQSHSAQVISDDDYPQTQSADALIARSSGTVAVVLTADCVPVLLSNRDGSEVAAIHAGWQGLYRGIIAQTVSQMHTPPQALYAWISAAIRQPSYEVDEAFYQRFLALSPDYAAFFRANRLGHYLADLPAIAHQQLQNAGLQRPHICDSGLCSFSDQRFFSYRRNQQNAGRMASFIAVC